jgi:lysozyme family protein
MLASAPPVGVTSAALSIATHPPEPEENQMAAPVTLTQKLSDEYQKLFDTCIINPNRSGTVDGLVGTIEQNRNRYAAVGDPLGIPWYFIGVIHNMEASQNFKKHLHNGDPLTARTVQVPAGRPKTGNPPFTWEESATDSLQLKRLDKWTDWSIPGTLYKLEEYNGWGYRRFHADVLTPYLWSFTNHYKSGKYVGDGKWSQTAVSGQCGAAALLRRMAEKGTIQFNVEGHPLPASVPVPESVDPLASFEPLITYSTKQKTPLAETLQKALNLFPGIFLKVDGFAGKDTSDAFHKVTGHFLKGDPRA